MPVASAWLDYLERLQDEPATAAHKAQLLSLLDLRRGQRVLDLGCGLGTDAWAMAEHVGDDGSVDGVDVDAALVERARQRGRRGNVSFHVHDAEQLPFEAEVFDRVRIDRVLHLVDAPDRVMAHVVRVCRPGGIVVAAEPDWGTLVFDAGDPQASRAIARPAPGTFEGRGLARLMLLAGLEDVAVTPATLIVRDLAQAIVLLRIDERIADARSEGQLEPDAARRWLDQQRRASERGTFFAALTGFIARAKRP